MNAACPTPVRCGARSHRVGTAAAAACALGAGATRAGAHPPPPAPVWDPRGGRPHPTGGYDAVVVETVAAWTEEYYASSEDVERTEHFLLGELHRSDGPALVEEDEAGRVCLAAWYERGQLHRGDGPAHVTHHGGAGYDREEYFYRDVPVAGYDELAQDRCEVLLAQGADPATVSGWLYYPQSLALALCTRLDEPFAAKAAYDAGVREVESLVAVATRRAPASWAASRS